jgi:hypothetical protein
MEIKMLNSKSNELISPEIFLVDQSKVEDESYDESDQRKKTHEKTKARGRPILLKKKFCLAVSQVC